MATIKSYNKRLEELRSERSTFMALWRELSDYHLNYRGRFLASDRNKRYKRNTKQYNNTSRLSTRTLASGMMSGITSPARPWFRLSAPTPELNEVASVKAWLHDVQKAIERVFSASNLYNTLHMSYAELGVFGMGAIGVFEDFENGIHCKQYTVGSYMIGTNGKNEVDTFYREYEQTVGQLVKQFGKENCSDEVKQLWDRGNTETWIKVVHAVEPNDDRDKQSPLAKDKAYRSVHYEYNQGNKQVKDRFLRESGFDDFPIMVPRWDLAGDDIYATDCPGMTALGDTKALQLGERRMYQALDKVVNPPMQAPASMKAKINKQSLSANELIYTPDGNSPGLRPIYDFRPDLNAMVGVNDRTEMRIKRAMYEDLFLLLTSSDRRQITAREVAEKHEEKLLMLGPVLERLHNELLDPLIDRVFSILQRNGALPPAPDELADVELRVDYVSVLAQAQRLVGIGAIEQTAGFVANMAALWPEARFKFDANQAVDDFAGAAGVNPRTVRSDDEANAMAQQEREAAAQAQALQQAQELANTAQAASKVDTSEGTPIGTLARNAGLI